MRPILGVRQPIADDFFIQKPNTLLSLIIERGVIKWNQEKTIKFLGLGWDVLGTFSYDCYN